MGRPVIVFVARNFPACSVDMNKVSHHICELLLEEQLLLPPCNSFASFFSLEEDLYNILFFDKEIIVQRFQNTLMQNCVCNLGWVKPLVGRQEV